MGFLLFKKKTYLSGATTLILDFIHWLKACVSELEKNKFNPISPIVRESQKETGTICNSLLD